MAFAFSLCTASLLFFGSYAARIKITDDIVAELDGDDFNSSLRPERDEHLASHHEEVSSPVSFLESDELDSSAGPLLKFPAYLKKKNRPDKYLGHGTFGVSWLVTDMEERSPTHGQQRVLKFLYIKNPRPTYLTWNKARYNKMYRREVLKAADECEISKYINKAGQASSSVGAQRVMNCFGHNVPVRDGKIIQRPKKQAREDGRPLYLLLENCGDKDLTKFMSFMANKKLLTAPIVHGLFKQIIEGLDFLGSLPVPYIHHDLKPDNIVVKTQPDGSYSVHLIDFGAATQATTTRMCDWTPATPVYAPPEYEAQCPLNKREAQNFDMCGGHSKSCALSFDIFAAGCILPEMFTGSWFFSFEDPAMYSKKEHRLAYKAMTSKFCKSSSSVVSSLTRNSVVKYAPVVAAFDERLVPNLCGMLASRASDRPTAQQVLADPVLADISTPQDLDYKQAKENRERVHVAPDPGKEPDGSGSASSSDGGDTSSLVRYKKGDFVEIFSYTLFDSTGNGWVKAQVEDVTDGDVIAVYPLPEKTYSKPIPFDDDLIRPWVEHEGEQADEEESLLMSQSFMPAVGLPDLVPGSREVEDDGAVCPSACKECVAAFDERNGKRRTFARKWASYCYYETSMTHAAVISAAKKAGVSCQMVPGMEEVGRKRYNKIMCQDIALINEHPR